MASKKSPDVKPVSPDLEGNIHPLLGANFKPATDAERDAHWGREPAPIEPERAG